MTYPPNRTHATSLLRSERLLQIVQLLSITGSATLASLTDALSVSSATIRRDLAELEDENVVTRTHGGAKVREDSLELPVRLRDTQHRRAKGAIARCTALLIPNGRHVVALSGGTTTEEVARVLASRRGLTVVTNSLTIATEIAPRSTIQVVMTGGVIRSHSLELVGLLSEHAFNAMKIGTAVLGADGMTAEGGATTHDLVEARTNLAMVSHAQRVIVVADGSKVGRTTMAKVADLEQISDFVTDSSADLEELELLRQAGVAVHVADR